ncbi:MAG: hypothetical protein IJ899_05645 [Blautia sp.]|nr:hypothetical protein [Blautia sp.]
MKRLLAIILFCLLLMTTGPVFATTGTEGIFTTEEETGSALSFEADSFSVYGVVYTVTYGDFEYEMLGNQETSLSELLSVLKTGIEIEEVVDVSSSGNGVMVSWLEDESDWLIKLLGEEEEIAEAPSTLTIKIASEREITITLTAVGLREIDLDGTIIKSADGLYLPEEAGGHSFIREEAEETIKAVEEFAAAETSAAKAFDEETAISASSEEAETSFSANAEENVFSSSEDAAEEDEADRHYTVFEIGLDNVDLENYANGFEVSVPLPESIFGKDFKLYHVHEGEVNEVGDLSVEDGMISFSTDSFSEFVLSYTVDFHWEVNGKIYDFSIPGGGFISLRQLVEILGIANDGLIDEDNRGAAITLNNPDVSEQTRKFVADVASVQFSDPSLVWIGKVDKASTVGELKNANGLNCQYSIELSEEQIAEINSSLVEAGDWALISLSPFTSEESLTVTMKDGVSFVIRVTDANANARKASLIWASNIQDGQKLVIYQKVIQADDSIYYYAIDGNGNLQRVYNSSDSVYWLNDLPIEWKITVLKDGSGNPTGYYTLYNETTHTYLVPKDDDGRYRVVHKLSDFSDGNTKNLEVSLPGKDAGQYLSKIASWDYDANVTYGIEVLSANDVHAKELLSSQDFYFAVPDNIVQGQLTQVETVNSLDKGIKITMYDFDSNEWQRKPEPRYTFMTRTIGNSAYNEGVYIPGLVKPRLGSDGFPVSVATNQSIKPVFESQGNYSPADSNSWPPNYGTTDYYYNVSKTENVNHLFLQSVYDATGYFYYSCFENFAKLNGNNFLVYEQLGTPYDGDDFFYKRGNFMPFNSLDLSHKKENITSSSSSSQLGMDNPRRGEDLYVVSGAADYYFGMTMEADFLQGPNGYNDRDEPTVFEFNGDDDLWIFIDGVLVLDIGGVHDAFQGTIDFKTGDVIVTADNGVSTTIKEMFRAARVFPDGTSWNENRVSEYFSGNTFKDYSTHSFKMFIWSEVPEPLTWK